MTKERVGRGTRSASKYPERPNEVNPREGTKKKQKKGVRFIRTTLPGARRRATADER